MANLYELTQSFLQVQNMIENDSEGLEDTLESIDLAINEKLENIAKVIKNLEGEINSFKAEEKRLSERRKTIENNIKRLKQYAEDSLKLTGERKIKAGTFTFNIQKNPPSVKVLNDKSIPLDYFNVVEPALDKKRLLKDLKNGESIEGAELHQGESLRIR